MTGIRVLGSIPLIKQSNIQFGSFDYGQLLIDTYGASEVWSLVDIESGTTIHAKVNSDRDGTLQGWDLQNADGPVSNTLAPYSDGANDYGDIYTSNGTTGLVDIFDGDEGSMFIWVKMVDATPWTDGGNRAIWLIYRDATNFLYLRKRNTDDDVALARRQGAATKSVIYDTGGDLNWFSLGMSWSVSNDELKAFYNGSQVGSTQTGITAMAGSGLDANTTLIGARDQTPTLVHDGWLAFAAIKFGSIWTPDDFLSMHNAATG